jgi:cytochrome c553
MDLYGHERLESQPPRMRRRTARIAPRRVLIAALCAIAALLLATEEPSTMDFPTALLRIDRALRTNPSGVSKLSLTACLRQRKIAERLYRAGATARAERSLRFCFKVLQIPETTVTPAARAAPDMQQIQAQAAREIEKALALTPNLERGLEIYRSCALCHMPEGWGLTGGMVPQIAGQHRTVIIKQLADIRAGNRDSVVMLPYASVEAIGGAQAVADVAGYIDTLEISVENGKGPGRELELGKRVYGENCARCHGATGEGNADEYVPRIQAQHYNYLLREFRSIQEGRRKNANAEMVKQIHDFTEPQSLAVLDYVSRLEPPAEMQAPPGWLNPDFTERPLTLPGR